MKGLGEATLGYNQGDPVTEAMVQIQRERKLREENDRLRNENDRLRGTTTEPAATAGQPPWREGREP